MRAQSKSKKLFKDVDPAEARKIVQDFFFNKFLPEDAARGEDEQAAWEAMFDKLTELERVVRDVKKRIKRG